MIFSVSVVLVFTFSFSLCNAHRFVCHHYDDSLKSLEIYCDYYRNNLPRNCLRNAPTINLSDVLHLKIEGCDQSFIGNASAKYLNIGVSDSEHNLLSWSNKGFENIISLDTSYNELTAIPTLILSKFPKIEKLNLANNKLTKILGKDFENVGQELKHILLTNNKLNAIDKDAFTNLKKLKGIELSNNQFSTFPSALSNHSGLQDVVMLENLQLTTIDCAFIEAIGSKRVYFSWKYITTFDGGRNCSKWKFFIDKNEWNEMDGIYTNWDGGSKLTCNSSDFQDCFKKIRYFTAGPGSFKNVHSMVKVLNEGTDKIDLSGNPVDELNATTFQRFQYLRDLNLSDTGLKEFDFNFIPKYLNRLDISKNGLKIVQNPKKSAMLKSLSRFYGAENQIENLNEVLQYLPSLSMQHLTLKGNPLNGIAPIGQFRALNHLDLSDTKLTLSNLDSLKPLQNLKSLDLSHNNLKTANFAALLSLNRLEEFRAAHSQIQNIAEIAQHLGPSVEKLELSQNPEAKFDPKSFNRLNNLKELDLSNSELEEIDVGQLPSSLERLDLHGNKLEEIKNLDRKHFPALKQLNILSNQLECDYLDELRPEFKDVNVVGIECERTSKFWIIFMAILVISLILFNLCSLWIMPKLCKWDKE